MDWKQVNWKQMGMNFLVFAGGSGGIVELLPDRYKTVAMAVLAFVLHNWGLAQEKVQGGNTNGQQ